MLVLKSSGFFLCIGAGSVNGVHHVGGQKGHVIEK
jgi:hypothetical protein